MEQGRPGDGTGTQRGLRRWCACGRTARGTVRSGPAGCCDGDRAAGHARRGRLRRPRRTRGRRNVLRPGVHHARRRAPLVLEVLRRPRPGPRRHRGTAERGARQLLLLPGRAGGRAVRHRRRRQRSSHPRPSFGGTDEHRRLGRLPDSRPGRGGPGQHVRHRRHRPPVAAGGTQDPCHPRSLGQSRDPPAPVAGHDPRRTPNRHRTGSQPPGQSAASGTRTRARPGDRRLLPARHRRHRPRRLLRPVPDRRSLVDDRAGRRVRARCRRGQGHRSGPLHRARRSDP